MAPTPDDVARIAALEDPSARNLQITQCYADLSRGLAAQVEGEANWCTFATWASRQAGQTIRKEDLTVAFERLLGDSPEAGWLIARFGALARLAARPNDAFARASDAVGRGNRKVFEEIGLEFARFLALARAGGTVDAAAYTGFRDSLRPGDPPDGQGYLREAFDAYAQALAEPDSKKRCELMLFANLAIGFHEQTRLQPEIAEALEAPFDEPVRLKRDLLKLLARSGVGLAARVLLELLPGRSTRLKRELEALDAQVKTIARSVITDHLMTLAVPGQVLDLGRDVSGAFPPDLRAITDPRLGELLARVDPTPDTTRGSGARDWSQLSERIHYIADLFRVNQENARLFEPPF